MNWQSAQTALLAVVLLAGTFAIGSGETAAQTVELTPPRLSFVEGRVSFWRPGSEDWAPARINTPLGAGDALYTGERATVEIQVGPRAFIRAREKTQFRLGILEPDFMQVSLTGGELALDLRALPPGVTVELGTPNAIFTIEQPGYYRAGVEDDVTHFVTRRGGRAIVTAGERASQAIAASEDVVVRGISAPTLETYVAPQLDAWDRWNYARTDHEIEALGARYVSPGVYGVGALDDWGAWRVVPDYGAVWVPERVAPGWAPYTTGSWIWDAYYGWTWVDDAPWGWAPFHYGRWLFINGYWAWAPGPVIARAVYAPALVAWFGVGSGVSVRIGISGPAVGWVALGWGEPVRPWWGRPGFVGAPWWGGWGGPRVVNQRVIERNTIVNVNSIVYEHARTPRAPVAVSQREFGNGPIRGTRFSPSGAAELEPIRDAHPVRPGPGSLIPARGDTVRPPAAVAQRPVLATRTPRQTQTPWQQAPQAQPKMVAPEPRVVPSPKRPTDDAALPRPSFGEKGRERQRPAPSPRFDEARPAPPVAAPQPPPRSEPAAASKPPATPRPAPYAAPPEQRAPAPAARPAPPGSTPAQESRVAPRPAPPTAGVQTPSPRVAPPEASKAESRPVPRAPSPPVAAQPERQGGMPQRALPGRPANEVFQRQTEGVRKPPAQWQGTAPGRAGDKR